MAASGSDSTSETRPSDRRIKLNVGGKLFETTVSTLQSGGPDSLLAALSNSRQPDDGDGDNEEEEEPIFIDRDPEIFSVLLSLLRTQRLPSTARRFPKQYPVEEALYYGIASSTDRPCPLPLSSASTPTSSPPFAPPLTDHEITHRHLRRVR